MREDPQRTARTPPAGDPEGKLEALILECLSRLPTERSRAVDEICDAHPELAPTIRRHLDTLRKMGLVNADPAGETANATEPDRFGDFSLLRRLGQGGMGVVYLAHQESLDRQVALKVIRQEHLHFPGARARFQREARTLSQLDHPGICPLFEQGEVDGTPYMAMAYLEGETLASRIDATRTTPRPGNPRSCVTLPKDRDEAPAAHPSDLESTASTPTTRDEITAVVHLVEKTALALHAAHEAGLIHRDIKPANIMIGPDGNPVVLDFGLVRQETGDTQGLTMTGQVLGTPAYMPPEQISPRDMVLDRRCDVYALGATLFECLTLQIPFQAENRESLYQKILSSESPDPRRLNPRVSKDLKVVVQTAMEKNRNRRYASALEFAADLRRLRRFEPIRARAAGPLLRLRRWTQRNPAVATFLILLTVALGVTARMLTEARAAQRKAESTQERLDHNLVAGLEADAETLWPAHMEQVPAMQRWLLRAEPLARRLEHYRSELSAAEERAQPYTVATHDHDRRTHPRFNELAAMRATMDFVSKQLASLKPESEDEKENEQQSRLERMLTDYKKEIAILEEALVTRRTWEYADEADQRRHADLTRLVKALERFTDPDPLKGDLSGIRKRLETARTIQRVSIDDCLQAWERARTAIRASPKYDKLSLAPQLGLVPLGPDPESGLWEFGHLESGDIPERGPDGKLCLQEESSLVFVLLTGDTFAMGSSGNKNSRNYVPKSFLLQDDEGPVHDVTLDPFFLSKYEMTQGQWLRMTGTNPALQHPGWPGSLVKITLLHPVEQVSWDACQRVLSNHCLCLPTEAQWEYACRAGTSSPWWTGDSPETLRGAENLGDLLLPHELRFYRGIHLPVGSLRANAFGLHDMLGNVSEWCKDWEEPYSTPVRKGTGELESQFSIHTYRFDHLFFRRVRGGNARLSPNKSRSAIRGREVPRNEDLSYGVRPARLIG